MAVCDVCGNDYDKAFQVITRLGETFHFDSLECAAVRLAPKCGHCGCSILGHGLEGEGGVFCCAHCARAQGERGLQDRAPGPARRLA